MADEWVDEVDDEDRVIGRLRRSEVYSRRANFRVAHVFLVNSRRELLIHQIASSKARFPGHWGSSVAGGVRAGEDPADAAVREVEEELGITAAKLRFVGKDPVREEGLTKFLYLFGLEYDGEVRPDPAEVEAIDFVPIDAISEMLRRRERRFTPTFQSSLDVFERARRAGFA